MPRPEEVLKPENINGKWYVELPFYECKQVPGYFINAAKQHFAGRNDLVGVEIGCAFGLNALSLLDELPMECLFAVDPWELHGDSLEYHHRNWAEIWFRVQKRRNIVIVKAFSEHAAKILTMPLDFVYIDGDHTKAYKDIEWWAPKVKPGGIVAGHDYNYHNIKKEVDDAFGDRVHVSPLESGTDWWVFV